MINNVVLVGRITKDLELRKTVSGQSVVNFTIAVNRQFSGPNGEREADFINCVVWSKIAENMVRFVGRGSLIGIEGSIRTRNYDGNDGKRVYITEVLCSSVQFLESRNRQSGPSPQDTGYYQDPPSFSAPTNDTSNFFQIPDVDLDEQFGKHPSTIDISDDDVPF